MSKFTPTPPMSADDARIEARQLPEDIRLLSESKTHRRSIVLRAHKRAVEAEARLRQITLGRAGLGVNPDELLKSKWQERTPNPVAQMVEQAAPVAVLDELTDKIIPDQSDKSAETFYDREVRQMHDNIRHVPELDQEALRAKVNELAAASNPDVYKDENFTVAA